MLQVPNTGLHAARVLGGAAAWLAGLALAAAAGCEAAPGGGVSGTLHPDAPARAASSPAAPILWVRVVKKDNKHRD
jgi:hypothetical protein